jgi:hypothetical protein
VVYTYGYIVKVINTHPALMGLLVTNIHISIIFVDGAINFYNTVDYMVSLVFTKVMHL